MNTTIISMLIKQHSKTPVGLLSISYTATSWQLVATAISYTPPTICPYYGIIVIWGNTVISYHKGKYPCSLAQGYFTIRMSFLFDLFQHEQEVAKYCYDLDVHQKNSLTLKSQFYFHYSRTLKWIFATLHSVCIVLIFLSSHYMKLLSTLSYNWKNYNYLVQQLSFLDIGPCNDRIIF